jgi:hypothetical protein
LFWSDARLDGQRITDIAPELVAAVSRRARKNQRVASALDGHAWIRDISGAMTVPMLI